METPFVPTELDTTLHAWLAWGAGCDSMGVQTVRDSGQLSHVGLGRGAFGFHITAGFRAAQTDGVRNSLLYANYVSFAFRSKQHGSSSHARRRRGYVIHRFPSKGRSHTYCSNKAPDETQFNPGKVWYEHTRCGKFPRDRVTVGKRRANLFSSGEHSTVQYAIAARVTFDGCRHVLTDVILSPTESARAMEENDTVAGVTSFSRYHSLLGPSHITIPSECPMPCCGGICPYGSMPW